jgi:tripartite-type tricarboxylate transporter receptor subunit TctC
VTLQAVTRQGRRSSQSVEIDGGGILMKRSTLSRWALATLAACPALGWAQGASFPVKPIRVICPAAPGGISDILSRIVAQRLAPITGQPVTVENRPGSGGHVAGEFVAKAPPDGYTVLQGTIGHNAAYAMYGNLPYQPGKDLQPVVLLGESQGVLVVHPSLPVRTVKEFVALAKARPGELNYGSAGSGTAIHMAAELFKWVAAVDITHVAYKGSSPAMVDLMGGQIQVMFENVATAIPFIKAGKIRPLGLTGRERVAGLPDVAPISELGLPAYEAVPYYTISTGSRVPADVVRKLNADIDSFLKQADLASRWTELGITPLGGSPETAVRRNGIETEKWTTVIKAARIRVD